jgi:hypothetical protein
MIVHLLDAGNVLDRDDASLAFARVQDRSPDLRDPILDDDIDAKRPVLLGKRR